MSSGMFRGKESSNQIELSRLVQELLNFMFQAPCSSGGWGGVGGWDGGWLGAAPHTHVHACACTHTQTCTCMRGKHDNLMQMAAPIGGIHGNSLWCHTHLHMRVHACMCIHVHVSRGHPLTTPTPSTHPPPPRGDPKNQSKFNSTWTNQDISILFEDLKSVETLPPKGGV